MREIYNRIKKLTEMSNTNIDKRFQKLIEEIGEFAQAKLSADKEVGCDYKELTKDDCFEEVADIIVVALSLSTLYEDKGFDGLMEIIEKKLNKWNKNVNKKKVNLAGIVNDSLSNGDGLRTVIFAQGCRHNCEECFNPHTHEFGTGEDFYTDDIIKKILDNPLTDGVTFSGGDPFEQAESFAEIAKEVRKQGKNVWCYTGYRYEEIMENKEYHKGWEELLNNIDYLVDGKFIFYLKDEALEYRGSTNQRIIDVQKSLKNGEIIVDR